MSVSDKLIRTDHETDAVGHGGGIKLPAEQLPTFIEGVNRANAFMSFANVASASNDEATIGIYKGRPKFMRQATQGAPVTAGTATFGQAKMTTSDYLAAYAISRQQARNSVEDPKVLLNEDLYQEFGLMCESEAFGVRDGVVTGTSGFNYPLATLLGGGTPRSVEWDPTTGVAGLRAATIAAKKECRAKVRASHVIYADAIELMVEGATKTNVTRDELGAATGTVQTSDLLYPNGVREIAPGLTAGLSVNLADPETAGSGAPIGIVGAFGDYFVRVREGVEFELSKDGVIKDSDGNELNALAQRLVIVVASFAAGGLTPDPEEFCWIVKK